MLMAGLRSRTSLPRLTVPAGLMGIGLLGVLLIEAVREVTRHDSMCVGAVLAAIYGIYFAFALCLVEPDSLTAPDRAGLVAITASVAYALLILATGVLGTGPEVYGALVVLPTAPVLPAVWIVRRRKLRQESFDAAGAFPTLHALRQSQEARRPWVPGTLARQAVAIRDTSDARTAARPGGPNPDVTLGRLLREQRLRGPWRADRGGTPCAPPTPLEGSARSR